MTDIMPQDEIDALLAEVSGETVNSTACRIDGNDNPDMRPKLYDFRRPQFMTKSAESRLRDIFATACDGIEAALGESAGIACDRGSITVDQLTCGEYVRSLMSPTLFSMIRVEPLPGYVAIEVMPSLACALIDAMAGRDIRDVSLNLGFTADEAREAAAPLGDIAESICCAFGESAELRSRVKAIYSNPRDAEFFGDDEMGVCVTCAAKIDYVEGLFSVFLPRISFGPVLSMLEENVPAADVPGNRVIDVPLKTRVATLDQVRKLDAGRKLEIDPAANPTAAMRAPMEE